MTQEKTHCTPVGVVGATGTTGVELVARLMRHPAVELRFATSREHAGSSLRTVDAGAPHITLVSPDAALESDAELIFTALPHGHSASWVKRVLSTPREPRVIDLSGDFRLRAPESHRSIYGSERDETLASAAVYGLTELSRDRIANTRLVANPGCYPTCSTLPLAPLLAQGITRGPITINALSGVSGAGRGLKAKTQFISVYDDVRPYGLGRGHRHAPEIEQSLRAAAGHDLRVVFNPHVIPIERGMLATISVATDASAERVHHALASTYASEPFIEVLPLSQPATLRAVQRTNRAVMGVHAADGTEHVVLTCAIDNLVKGAAGQAIQNMNVMLGLPETTGFEHEQIGVRNV